MRQPKTSPRYSFTQPICDDCWDLDHPDKRSPRRGRGFTERCCKCQASTRSGLYIRVDPATVAWPTLLKD